MTDWYEVIESPELEQGDVIPTMAVLVPVAAPADESAGANINGKLLYTTVIVLTQTCNILNDEVTELLLAQVIAYDEMVATEDPEGPTVLGSRKYREALVAGNVPALSLLHEWEGPPAIGWSLVNFRRLFSLPKSHVADTATRVGPRLRLRSPYREHVAQAFGRDIIRVGLPVPAEAFKGYKPRTA